MKRLNILVEGQTEENFVRDVLALHLANYGVIVNQQRFETGKTRPFNPTGNRQTVVHKGGITGYEQVCKHLTRWRKSEPNAVLTTMIDLYGLPTDFPKSTSSDALEKVKFLEQALENDLGLHDFIPYFQLHEFEALLFSNVQILDNWVSISLTPDLARLKTLLEICNAFETPEHINDSPLTAPSKRLFTIYDQAYQKTLHGSIVASEIGLAAIRRECQHFDAWLTKLENLNSQGAS